MYEKLGTKLESKAAFKIQIVKILGVSGISIYLTSYGSQYKKTEAVFHNRLLRNKESVSDELNDAHAGLLIWVSNPATIVPTDRSDPRYSLRLAAKSFATPQTLSNDPCSYSNTFACRAVRLIQKAQSAAPPAIVARICLEIGKTFFTVLADITPDGGFRVNRNQNTLTK